MLHNTNLLDHVFSTPYESGFDTVHILSGYASPKFLVFILNKFPNLSIELTIGMISKDKIFEKDHFHFIDLTSRYPRLTINYVTSAQPNHSKIYHWLNSQSDETTTFIGSANFSINGFFINQETMFQSNEIDDGDFSTNFLAISCTSDEANRFVKDDLPVKSDIHDQNARKEYMALFAESENSNVFYSEADLHILDDYSKVIRAYKIHSSTNQIKNSPRGGGFSSLNVNLNSTPRSLKHTDRSPVSRSNNLVVLSLLTRKGEVGATSGLNWGQRDGRNHNQAYIPVPGKIHKDQPDFFPESGELFTIQTDDGVKFTCVMAQSNRKAIHTHESNALLGTYFREKLGLPEGTFITFEHLQHYGKTDVIIKKIDNLSYQMSF